ncbi:hypothetical protein NEY51_003489 [Vibrio cholerae]
MFWGSVWDGVLVFAHWEVWVVVGAYMVAMFGITMIGGLLISKKQAGLGMLWMFLAAPLLQVFATLVAVMTLAPILFSLGDSAAWALPWVVAAERTWRIVKFVGILVLVLVGLGVVGLGRLPGVTQFTTGALATASTASLLAGISPNLKSSDLDLWPGFLVVVGFLLVAAALQFVVMVLISVISTALKIDPDENEGSFMLLVMPVSAAVMFLPTFMYAAYLAPQLAKF